eukprot:5153677-Karenia_brevis.AAC.1
MAISARQNALGGNVGKVQVLSEHEPFIRHEMRSFNEALSQWLCADRWRLLHMGQLKSFRHITYHEARGWSWAFRHALRNTARHGH